MKTIDGCGEEGAKAAYNASKIDVAALLPEDKRSEKMAVDLLADNGVAFVAPQLVDQLKKANDAAATAAVDTQLKELSDYLASGVLAPVAEEATAGDGPRDAAKWIDDHCADLLESGEAKLERTVMRCVLSAGMGNDEPDAKLAPKLCKQIERCAKLLQKCTASTQSESKRLYKQANCLYEVQAFCAAQQWPSGLIKKLFYNLYESDVVFEDAYGVWREDVNDDTPGKDKALFQVNEFLQWLDEAAEEGEGDEEDA